MDVRLPENPVQAPAQWASQVFRVVKHHIQLHVDISARNPTVLGVTVGDTYDLGGPATPQPATKTSHPAGKNHPGRTDALLASVEGFHPRVNFEVS